MAVACRTGVIRPLWLEPPPEAGRLAEAVEALARIEGYDTVSPPTAQAAFETGQALVGSDDENIADRGRCWLWVAAALGLRDAVSEISRQIVDVGARRGGGLESSEILKLVSLWLHHASAAPMAPQPGFLRRSQLSRGRVASLPVPPAPPGRRSSDPETWEGVWSAADGLVQEESADYDEEASAEEEELKPGVVVVRAIGDPASKEGREIAKRYAHFVGVRLPLRGVLPNPSAFSADFLAAFPWAHSFARYLRGHFALLAASGRLHPFLPPILLVGPSGCGKTRMLEWITSYLGRPSQTIPIGGTNDSAGLTAVARGWLSTQASAPVQLLAESGCANPCLILDEVDKGVAEAGNRNGSVSGALLAILQPPEGGYRDSFLMAPVDLSHMGFLATANNLNLLPSTLRGRFNIHRIPAPGPEHFDSLMATIIPAEAARLGVEPAMMPWVTPGDREWLRAAFIASKGDIRRLVQAYLLLVGDRAAEEEMMMRRPH